jgi:hypothetical protein
VNCHSLVVFWPPFVYTTRNTIAPGGSMDTPYIMHILCILSRLGSVASCSILSDQVKGHVVCELDYVEWIYLMYDTLYGLFHVLNPVIVKIPGVSSIVIYVSCFI